MKKILLSSIAVAILTLSCTNGSASSLENSDQEVNAVASAVNDKVDDSQSKGSGKPVYLTK